MNEDKIKEKLLKSGYSEKQATATASNLCKVAPELQSAVEQWLLNDKEVDVESHGYSTSSLMERFKGMTYPAALLSIDWIMKEPEQAIKIIEKGIR